MARTGNLRVPGRHRGGTQALPGRPAGGVRTNRVALRQFVWEALPIVSDADRVQHGHMRHATDDSHYRGPAWFSPPALSEVTRARTSRHLVRWAAAAGLLAASGVTVAACGSTTGTRASTTHAITTPTNEAR